MTQIVFCVICDNGDGSNSLEWFTDDQVLKKMEELVDEGDETYASGDGLQVQEFYFPDDFDLKNWFKVNHISLTTYEEIADREAY